MAHPITVDNSRPATVRDTARILGVSKKRTNQLIQLVRRIIHRDARGIFLNIFEFQREAGLPFDVMSYHPPRLRQCSENSFLSWWVCQEYRGPSLRRAIPRDFVQEDRGWG